MSIKDIDADDLATALTDAMSLVEEHAVDRGYCPACFLVAFSKSILAFEASHGFPHVAGLLALELVDHIGETEGNA